MTIHREGHRMLIWTLAMVIAVIYGANLYLSHLPWVSYTLMGASLVVFVTILQFFRNPSRAIEVGAKKIIAPADGKVVVIEEVEEPEYFHGKRKQVSIFMSPINVHINRSPIKGLVKYFKYHPGKYLVAWHPKASTENERTTMVLETECGQEVLVRQIAGALAKRIKWYVNENDRLDQGEEFGFIKFGSRVDLFLPLDAKVCVEMDQKSRGGQTVVAELA